MVAFKNFTDPIGALNEIHRVLKPGGQASIFDLRKDAAREDIDAGVRDMQLSAWNALVTHWIFRTWLPPHFKVVFGQCAHTPACASVSGQPRESSLANLHGVLWCPSSVRGSLSTISSNVANADHEARSAGDAPTRPRDAIDMLADNGVCA